MKGIAIGVSNFKVLRHRDNYFRDNQLGVVLMTRPRRFEKTLNMSMLKYYFDCTKIEKRDVK